MAHVNTADSSQHTPSSREVTQEKCAVYSVTAAEAQGPQKEFILSLHLRQELILSLVFFMCSFVDSYFFSVNMKSIL